MWHTLTLDERALALRQHIGELILIDHDQRGTVLLLLMRIEWRQGGYWLSGFEDGEANGLCALRLDHIRECLMDYANC